MDEVPVGNGIGGGWDVKGVSSWREGLDVVRCLREAWWADIERRHCGQTWPNCPNCREKDERRGFLEMVVI